jgi:hypothetical protein
VRVPCRPPWDHHKPVISADSCNDIIDDDSEDEDEEFDDVTVVCEAEELQALIDAEEQPDTPMRSARLDREIMSLTCAAIAVSVDEQMRVYDNPHLALRLLVLTGYLGKSSSNSMKTFRRIY